MSIFLTGSGDLPPILYVEGRSAGETYSVPVLSHNGPCPHCQVSISQVLDFNPTDSYYYLHCPVCIYTFRFRGPYLPSQDFFDMNNFDENYFVWMGPFGDIPMADLKVVVSTKTTPLDNDIDFPDNWT